MRYLMLVALLVAASPASAVAQTTNGLFSCSTGENHERWALKGRSKPSSLASAKPVTLATVLSWAIPAGHTDSDEAAIPPREPKLYTLSGFVRKIKQSDDDCDLHLELAPSGDANEHRVIVEVSANQPALQQTVAGMFNLSTDVQSHTYNADKAKKITVTGYAFIDLSHQCSKWPTKGCQHGGADVWTIWELHPVVAVKWAQ
jgi:hypothetical protein